MIFVYFFEKTSIIYINIYIVLHEILEKINKRKIYLVGRDDRHLSTLHSLTFSIHIEFLNEKPHKAHHKASLHVV